MLPKNEANQILLDELRKSRDLQRENLMSMFRSLPEDVVMVVGVSIGFKLDQAGEGCYLEALFACCMAYGFSEVNLALQKERNNTTGEDDESIIA